MTKVLLSIAHSKSTGAKNKQLKIEEYDISVKMTESAISHLLENTNLEIVNYDALDMYPYRRQKIDFVNDKMPDLALEIHLNSVDSPVPNYSSCFYWHKSISAAHASRCILESLKSGFVPHGWHDYKMVSLPAPGYDMRRYWFITKTGCPSIIVEPLFLSNYNQAKWLTEPGAPEAIGVLVAEGIIKWSQSKQLAAG